MTIVYNVILVYDPNANNNKKETSSFQILQMVLDSAERNIKLLENMKWRVPNDNQDTERYMESALSKRRMVRKIVNRTETENEGKLRT